MEDSNNQNKRIIFSLPDDAIPIEVVSDILKQNGIEESLDEFCQKLEQKLTPKSIILNNAIKDLVAKRFSEKELISSLQSQLKVSKELAEKLLKDAKGKLIPFAKEIVIKKEEIKEKIEPEESLALPKIKPPLNLEQSEERPQLPPKDFLEKKVQETMEEIKNPKETFEKPKKSQKEQDTYREPIE